MADLFLHKSSLVWDEAKIANLKLDGAPDVKVTTSVNYGGLEGEWTPSDLFLASVNACNAMTFLEVVLRKGVELESFECEAEGIVERTEEGYRFTSITLKPRAIVKDPGKEKMVNALIERAHKACLVANSMKNPVDIKVD